MHPLLLSALIAVESGGNDQAKGRHGELGPLQIKSIMVRDVNRFARTRLAMTLWPTLPDARETFIAEVGAVVREVLLRDVDGDLAIGDILVRVMRMREAVAIADHD